MTWPERLKLRRKPPRKKKSKKILGAGDPVEWGDGLRFAVLSSWDSVAR